jgi:pimeloyl-ACP methyl ester carboxylesterase
MATNSLTLRPFSGVSSKTRCHVIFIHGLDGDAIKTWEVGKRKSKAMWPLWLEDDVNGLRTWTVGYPASSNAWRSGATPILDRGNSILNRLMLEPDLRSGTIVIVGHSMGGLIAKQILQSAETIGRSDAEAASFRQRIRGVVFAGTPHAGSLLANFASWFPYRRSAAVDALLLDNPNVRSLNEWYDGYRDAEGLLQLNLIETRAPRIFGLTLPKPMQVVPRLSGTAVGGTRAVDVDTDHTGVCKPESTDSPIYLNIRRLVEDAISQVVPTPQALAKLAFQRSTTDPVFVDKALRAEIDRLKRVRFFDSPAPAQVEALAQSIEKGQYVGASHRARALALAWCARLIAKANPARSLELAGLADALAPTPESSIAAAVARIYQASDIGLRSALIALGTTEGLGAALLVTSAVQGGEKTNVWCREADISLDDVDSDGKFGMLYAALDAGKWPEALAIVALLSEQDFERTPALLYTAAEAHLVQVVPEELRPTLRESFPHTGMDIPFGARPEDAAHLQSAARFYRRAATVSAQLGADRASRLSQERAYGIEIMLPEHRDTVLAELRSELATGRPNVRTLAFALRYMRDLDISNVDSELDRSAALSGASNVDIALARRYVTLSKETQEERFSHFERYRKEMAEFCTPTDFGLFAITILTDAGRQSEALEHLEGVREAITPDSYDRLRLMIDTNAEVNDTALLEDRFKASGSIGDLQLLCATLRNSGQLSRLVPFAEMMYARTNAIRDLVSWADALHATFQFEKCLALIGQHPTETAESSDLRRIACLANYANGKFDLARDYLLELRNQQDTEEYRQLFAALLICSGDWEALEGHVNQEWDHRASRSATEVARVGTLAQQAGSSRTFDLVRDAAARGQDDPHVLIACYSVATKAGHDNLSEVAAWLQRAADLSKTGVGPVEAVDFEALMSHKSKWEETTQQIRRMLIDAIAPMSIAARRMNSTLAQMIVQTGLANQRTNDAWARAPVYACSGNEKDGMTSYGRVGVDATALLQLELLDSLQSVISTHGTTVVPHDTLSWLFNECAKVRFHQPSRIEQAHLVRRLLAEDRISVFAPEVAPESGLVAQVGEALAGMVSSADARVREGSPTRVLHGAPVYGLGSFMKTEVDMSAYHHVLASCQGLSRSMYANGAITKVTLDHHLSFLTFVEQDWRDAPPILTGSRLLLDGAAMSRLLHLHMLDVVIDSGYQIQVDPDFVAECDALLRHEAEVNETLERLDHLRRALRDGLRAGTVEAAAQRNPKDGEDDLRNDPSIAIIDLGSSVDGFIIGDRSLNRNGALASADHSTPIADVAMTLTKLHRDGHLGTDSFHHRFATMRQSGFLLVPITTTELLSLTEACPVRDGQVVETAELRAITEYLLQVRSSELPLIPAESFWYDQLHASGLECIARSFEIHDPERARAIATWLWERVDPCLWAFCVSKAGIDPIRLRDIGVVRLILSTGRLEPDQRLTGQAWLDATVLNDMAESSPDSFAWVCGELSRMMMTIPLLRKSAEEDYE